MALTRRLIAFCRRSVKAVAYQVARPVALRLPVDVGPARVRRLSGQIRSAVAVRVVRRNPGAAGAIVAPLLDTADAGRAWYVIALAREKERDPSGALDAARQATEIGPQAPAPLLTHRRLAQRAGHQDEARELLERLVTRPPKHPRQVTATLDALSDADAELVARYEKTLRGSGVRYEPERVRELESALRLVELYSSDRGAYAAELRRVSAERKRPAHVVTRALVTCGAWDELARFLDGDLPGITSTIISNGSLPVFHLNRAARRAFSAGRTSAAVSLARRVLDADPRDPKVRAVLEDGADQLAIIERGWPALPPPGATPYQPRPRAVMSVLAQSHPVTTGGYATRTHGILTGLAARGWDVRAVTRLGFPLTWWRGIGDHEVRPLDVVDGIEYHRLYDEGVLTYPEYPLASYVGHFADRLVEHAVEHRARLIHASSFYWNGLAAAAAARRLGLPFLYEIRGLMELMKVAQHPSFADSDQDRFFATVENAACRDADAVFVITEALRREMIDRGVPGERMVVLPNGVHVDRFSPRERDAELARQMGVTDKTVIGYAGGLVHYEGLDLLLEAAAALKERRNDFHVVIVGDGTHQHVLHGIAERLRLGDVVTFTGRVPHAEVGRYISLFDIAPFPRKPLSVCEIISPMKPFESMAMEKAVVVSSVAALTEIVDDERTGLVFGKGSAEQLAGVLERLLDSPELRASLGRAARTWVVAERDWSSIMSIVETTYDRLLESARSR